MGMEWRMMLPAILKINIPKFAAANEKVWYSLIREPKMLKESGTEWFFELKNKEGTIIQVFANDKIFRLYRVK